jgi:hypothetical protein
MNIKKAVIGVCVIFLSYFLFILLFSKQPPSSSPVLSESSQKDTTLHLSPNPLILTKDTGKIDIVLHTGSNEVSFVQIKLFYDPTRLSEVNIIQGPFMQKASVLSTYIDTQKGTITYMLTLAKKEKPVQGKGIIATIMFNSLLKPKQTTILAFSKETFVTDNIHTDSILKETKGTTVQRKN